MFQTLGIQLIGFIAVSISLGIFQTNKRSTILKLVMCASVFYVAHFFLLGAITGAVMNLIGGVRSFVYSKFPPSNENRWLLHLFIAIAVVAAALTWEGPLSLLPMIGSITGAIMYWQRTGSDVRRWGFVGLPFWLAYDTISGSYAGMSIDIILMISNIVGRYRFNELPALEDIPKLPKQHLQLIFSKLS